MREKQVLENARREGLALTYNDVRLRTAYSDVLPGDVDLSSKFSRNVGLKVPIVSAAMDTVTEYKLAIEMAKLGGLGVIHRNLIPEDQAVHVARVKNYLNGLVERPICVFEDEKVSDVLRKRDEKRYTFNSFPVLNRGGKLVGIVTGNDFDFCDDHSSLVGAIMSREVFTARTGIGLDEAYGVMQKNKRKFLPLVNDQGAVRGLYVFSDLKRIKTQSAEGYNLDRKGRLVVGAAIGTGEAEIARAEKLVGESVDVLVIDTAHGDSKSVYETLRELKRKFSADVVVGNVSVGGSAKRLLDAGADGIKVGQGPGSICTTRDVAGIGRPQVSAVYDCAREVSEVPICADGGLTKSGEIPIAIAAGASSVMMGNMLAGTTEAPGEVIFYKGRTVKIYRGMGSREAMAENQGSRQRYNQGSGRLVPEGVKGAVPFIGALADAIYDYLGGLRKGMGYTGSRDIGVLKGAEFDRITNAGLNESHPHDIEVIADAPAWRADGIK